LAIAGEAVGPFETPVTKKPPWRASRTRATANPTMVASRRNAGGPLDLVIGLPDPRKCPRSASSGADSLGSEVRLYGFSTQ
jgi:hypothetical protein